MRAIQISSCHASLASSLNCLIKTCKIWIKRTCVWVLSFHVVHKAPLLILPHLNSCIYHLAMSHASYCALHLRVLICSNIFLYVRFGFSRVEPESEQFEQEFDYTPEEDIVGFSTADLTGEPTSFTYFTFSCSFDLLLSLCCVSVVSCVLLHLFTDMSRVTPPLPTTCCLLFDKPCES